MFSRTRIALSLFVALSCVSFGTHADAMVIASGSGTVFANKTNGPTSGFAGNQVQAIAVMDSTVVGGVSANDVIGITGSMTLGASVPGEISFSDRVNLAISGDGNFLASSPSPTSSNIALYAQSSVNNNPNTPFTIATDGNALSSGTHGNAASIGTQVNYALNVTFPANFEDGGASGSYAYAFELGLDFDSNGSFDEIQSGTFLVDSGGQASNRFRFGFGVFQGNRTTPDNLSNSYTFVINDEPVDIPEPGSLALAGIGCGLLLTRRRK